MVRTKTSGKISVNHPKSKAIESYSKKATGREPLTAFVRRKRAANAPSKKNKKRVVEQSTEEIPPV